MNMGCQTVVEFEITPHCVKFATVPAAKTSYMTSSDTNIAGCTKCGYRDV